MDSTTTSESINHPPPDLLPKYQGWHKKWIEPSATLVALDQVPDHLICRRCKTYMKRDTDFGIVMSAFLLGIIAGLILTNVNFFNLSSVDQQAMGLGVGEALVLSPFVLPWTRRTSAEGNLLKRLISTITWIESQHDEWREPRYRRKACRKLEKLARSVDWMPHVLPGKDNQNRSNVVARSSGVATSLRDLKGQILMPDLDAWDELRPEFLKRLDIVLNTGWWNWPTRIPEDLDRRRTVRSKRHKTIAGVLTAVLLVALGIWLTTLPKPVSVIAASFALSTAVAVFGRSGVELSSLKDASDLVKLAESQNNESRNGP
jgi:hypothetical protein